MNTDTSELYSFIQTAPMMENTESAASPRNTETSAVVILSVIFPVSSLEDFHLFNNQHKSFQALQSDSQSGLLSNGSTVFRESGPMHFGVWHIKQDKK